MAEITLEHVTKAFSGGVLAVDDVNLTIEDGEFMVLVGPSGCGKSTLLRMIAGLEEITDGSIIIGGRAVTELPPPDRDIAMVFQNYALYPHMNVRENLGFGLSVRRTPKAEMNRRIEDVASLLGLELLLDRKPAQLSGGQRQRVAMGRAIVREPSVFLMDEPLSNLDAQLRVQMRADIAALQSRLGVTTVYVTHDQSEAMTLGHRVAVLKDARLQQCDTPHELYARPVNTFVAGFIGSPSMNLCELPLTNGSVSFGGVSVPVPAGSAGESIVLGFRPEALELATDGVDAKVEVIEELGADAYVFCVAEINGTPTKLVARGQARNAPHRGARVKLRPAAEEAHLFHPHTGERIST
jgi:multiple sugar transport system ATP-binding protein